MCLYTWSWGGTNRGWAVGPVTAGRSISLARVAPLLVLGLAIVAFVALFGTLSVHRHATFGTAGNADKIKVRSLAQMQAAYDSGALKPTVH